MKRRIILTLLSSISIAALTQGCTVWSDSADNVSSLFAKSDKGWLALSDYDRGKHYMAVGDYGLAIEAFNAALSKDAKSVPAMNGLAIAYDRIGRGDVAKSLLAKALELNPRSADTLNNIAYLELSHGERDQATLYFSRAKEALASAAPSETSARLETVIDNNQALMSAQNAPARPGETAASQQVATSRTAAAGTVQGPALPQVVDSNIWNLQISGTEAKLIPPASSLAQTPAATGAFVGYAPRSPVVVSENSQREKMTTSAAATSRNGISVTTHEASSQGLTFGMDVTVRTQAKSGEAAHTSPAVSAIRSQLDTARLVVPAVSEVAFPRQVTVRIANGTGRRNMAHRFQHYFGALGLPVHHLVNVPADCSESTIYYSRGQEKAADALAQLLPISVRTIGLSNNFGEVELMLAPDLAPFDRSLIERRSS